jgi:hypothetical protein
MNSHQSKSVKLVPTRATKTMPHEVDILNDEDSQMSSSVDNVVYCHIA